MLSLILGGVATAGPGQAQDDPGSARATESITVYATADARIRFNDLDSSWANQTGASVTNEVGCFFGAVWNPIISQWELWKACNISAIYFPMPVGLNESNLVSATLRLWACDSIGGQTCDFPTYTTGIQFDAHAITHTWSEGTLTWNLGLEWWLAGGATTTPAYSPSVPSEWDVTDIVAEWVSGRWTNHGVAVHDPYMLHPGLTYLVNAHSIYESTEAYNAPGRRPSIEIVYTVDDPVYCAGIEATKVGTDSSETIVGTAGNDVIQALGGNDIIDGAGGHDLICGGNGNDIIEGGSGNDIIHGGNGNDTVDYSDAPGAVTVSLKGGFASGGAGSDTLSTVEHIVGSAYHDTLTGNPRNNRILGGAGKDLIAGMGGADKLFGGGGIDTAVYTKAGSGVTVDLTAGTATGGHGNDTLRGIENVNGSVHRDLITGDENENRLSGGKGNDRLSGLAGRDVLLGGPGSGDNAIGGGGWDKCKAETTTGCEWTG